MGVALCALMLVACNRRAEVYVTSAEGDVQTRFAQSNNVEMQKLSPAEGNYIKLLSDNTLQPIYGVGAAITGSTCYNLLKMSEEDREKILQECFSPDEMAMSFIRISIGASDFSLDEYIWASKRKV